MIKHFCDRCKNELTKNVYKVDDKIVDEKYRIEVETLTIPNYITGQFSVYGLCCLTIIINEQLNDRFFGAQNE